MADGTESPWKNNDVPVLAVPSPSHSHSHSHSPPRVLGRLRSDGPGPTVIGIGSLHGNEPAGSEALREVLDAFTSRALPFQGELVGLTGNIGALVADRRFLDADMNRLWPSAAGTPRMGDHCREAAELAALSDEIQLAIHRARGPVFLLDLHTTSGPSSPFVLLGDTLRNRRFATRMGCPLILGLEEYLDGTLLAWADEHGCVAMGVEGGQHLDPDARPALVSVIWSVLMASGFVGSEVVPQVLEARSTLARLSNGLPTVFEVRYRHQVQPNDSFEMCPGFRSFDLVRRGREVAKDRTGNIVVEVSGRLLMPLYQTQGVDGFFLIRPVRPFWLHLSVWCRRLRLERVARHLPGVHTVPSDPTAVVVNRRVARWFALHLFHLLGYRRIREEGPDLRLSRRPEPDGRRR